jgi:hypothetical protein
MSKVKVIKSKTNVDLKEINKYYNQLTGIEGGDPVVIETNYGIMYENLTQYHKILDKFSNSNSIINTKHPEHATEIQSHVTQLKTLLETTLVISTPTLMIDTKTQDDKVKKYKMIKESPLIKQIIVLFNNLNKYDTDIKNLDDAFVRKFVGFDLFLFPFSTLNFKLLLSDESGVKYYLTVLSLLLKFSEQIYKTFVKPDIDPRKFGEVVVAAIGELKKRIPRCDDAFKAIENSINLFEGNFDTYYKNFVTSKNPTIIIESFIADICDRNEGNSQVESQMKQIIKFIRTEMSKQNVKDPKMANMASSLDDIMNGL